MIKLPGLIDAHVHMREPGGTHKEDWSSGTAAAIAGGFTMVLAMPNTLPPVTNGKTLEEILELAGQKALCDFAQFVGASFDNTATAGSLSTKAAGLKMYLDQTYGPLRLDDMADWLEHFRNTPLEMPIAVHAEGPSLAAAILLSQMSGHPVHLCHISRRDEILLIREAKEKGLNVTCEVTPHHLFLSEADTQRLGKGRCEVRPVLNRKEDQQALWENLEYIDCFATDHAPHTLIEKDSGNPPPGFPGLETSLPLLLNAVSQGRLSLEDIILRSYTNPRRIFNLPEQKDTWIEVDLDAETEVKAQNQFTRCGWTPFEGFRLKGKVVRTVLRGKTVFENETILADAGYGKNIRV